MKKPQCLLLALFFCLAPLRGFSQAPQALPTLELLREIIRIDTSNPPGGELKLAQFIQGYLRKFGIEAELIESAPGRASLLARLKGSGKKEPLVLLGHLDVVPADPKEWDHPPFAAAVKDGYLYGRGALDMKGLVALEIATFVKLKQDQTPLAGDVLLILAADEEAGGPQGAKFLVEKHWDKIQAKYVFNEGSIGNTRNGKHYYPIQVAEKGVAWMKLTASGKSGHGSMPSQDNAVLRLIRALDKLTDKPQPLIQSPIVEEFLDRIAENEPFLSGFALKHFFTWPVQAFFKSKIEAKLQVEKALNAMLRNTITPTMLEAGYKVNVIPNQASASLDARVLPGFTPQGFKKIVEEKIADPNVKVELLQESLPNESDFHTDYFRVLEGAIQKNDPGAIVMPYMSPGATDSRFFRAKGALAYGIIPFVVETSELQGIHGKNERLQISEIERGEKIVWDLVTVMQGED